MMIKQKHQVCRYQEVAYFRTPPCLFQLHFQSSGGPIQSRCPRRVSGAGQDGYGLGGPGYLGGLESQLAPSWMHKKDQKSCKQM